MIAFFTRNGVAANLLMVAIILAGLYALLSGKIPLEVFPEYDSRTIAITVPYRGATPEEVEESVLIRVEEAIATVEGIEEIVSTANSSGGTVMVTVKEGYEMRDVRDQIEAKVNAITDFPPGDAESVTVRELVSSRWVVGVVLSGDLSERDLISLGGHIRDDITNLPDVTSATLQGVRPFEIQIEIDEAALQEYGLSFGQISQALRASSLDIPAGTLETPSGNIVLRTKGRAYNKEQFENITLRARTDGTRLTVGDVAKVTDGFDENRFIARMNGKRCVIIAVFREGNQSAIQITKEVRQHMIDAQPNLPEGVEVGYLNDTSKIVKGRLNTLLMSGWKSMIFVFILLTLFLRPSLALWVVIGIPISFLGAISLMPLLGVSINIVTLFGFILVLGVVVDDAIVTGENIYTKQQCGVDPVEASILGAEEVSLPVVFGVLTTMLAFVPLYFMKGFNGAWMPQISTIVITVLAFSLTESKLVLPSHLTCHPRRWARFFILFFLGEKITEWAARGYGALSRMQRAVAASVETFVNKVYQPLLDRALAHRYSVFALFVGTMILIIGAFFGGRIKRVSFPRVESEHATCRLTMQEGTPFEVTQKYILMMTDIVNKMKAEYVGSDGVSVIQNVFSTVGGQKLSSSRSSGKVGRSHQGEVTFYITPPEERKLKVGTRTLINELRRRIQESGGIIGAKELFFRAEIGRGRDPIDVRLRGNNIQQLTEAAGKVRKKLGTYAGLYDISDSLDESLDEIQLRIRPEAEQYGLTMQNLARQVRQAFFGEEIQKILRDRDEVRVMLKFPRADRKSVASLESMRIRTASGQEVPFTTVAEAKIAKSFPKIERIDRNRAVEISADADKETVDLASVREELGKWLSSELRQYPGMTFSFEGEARDEKENSSSIWLGAALILFGIYAMLAIPFRSYIQPLLVMSVIPFGLIGAVLGHLLEDYLKRDTGGMPLSFLSYFGMLALSGVVVNDSLVLVDYINRKQREGSSLMEAVSSAGAARFRAIILTSATTFAGLLPLIRMQATQAQFLIPMAVSLGYGIVFATLITLFFVPVNFLIMEDIKKAFVSMMSLEKDDAAPLEGAKTQ